jgi:hypothetical protein
MANSAISTPTAQQLLSNIAVDGSAASPHKYSSGAVDVTMNKNSAMVQRVVSPAAAKTVTLPTTDIKAGYQMLLRVSGATEANYVVLKSSDADEIDRIGEEGVIHVMALQDTPTDKTHWVVLRLFEKISLSGAISSGGGTGSPVYAVKAMRSLQGTGGSLCGNITVCGTFTTGTSPSTDLVVTGAIPTRFRPTRDMTNINRLSTASDLIYAPYISTGGNMEVSLRTIVYNADTLQASTNFANTTAYVYFAQSVIE